MLGNIIGLVWASHAIQEVLSIAMLGRCHCSLRFIFCRRLTIVWLLGWQRQCLWLVRLRWLHIEGIWYKVVGPADAMVGGVVVTIFYLVSIGGVVDSGNNVLVVWHVLRDLACQLMITVCQSYSLLNIMRPWCRWSRMSACLLAEIISMNGCLWPILDKLFVLPVSPPLWFFLLRVGGWVSMVHTLAVSE